MACSKCGKEPRGEYHAWGRNCQREYHKAYRAKLTPEQRKLQSRLAYARVKQQREAKKAASQAAQLGVSSEKAETTG